MDSTTSYVIAGVSAVGICFIRICIRKIRDYFSNNNYDEKNEINNKNPIYI
jgi:hypothetical protein